MTEPLVRGHWITGALAFMGVHYSSEMSERLLAGLPRGLRASAAQLGPAEWCPRSQHVDLMKTIASVHKSETRAYDDLLAYGQFVGSEAAHGPLEMFLRISTLKLFAKKLPVLWARDHQDDGALESDFGQIEEARLPLRLSGVGGYEHVGVAALGWIKGLMAGFEQKAVRVRQSGWSLAHAAPDEMTCEVMWS